MEHKISEIEKDNYNKKHSKSSNIRKPKNHYIFKNEKKEKESNEIDKFNISEELEIMSRILVIKLLKRKEEYTKK